MVFFRTLLPDARSLSKNKGLVNQERSNVTILSSNAPQALKPIRESVRSEPNRPRVLRDQKVLPEVRNRPLLQGE